MNCSYFSLDLTLDYVLTHNQAVSGKQHSEFIWQVGWQQWCLHSFLFLVIHTLVKATIWSLWKLHRWGTSSPSVLHATKFDPNPGWTISEICQTRGVYLEDTTEVVVKSPPVSTVSRTFCHLIFLFIFLPFCRKYMVYHYFHTFKAFYYLWIEVLYF
jgi:hypothetical protein